MSRALGIVLSISAMYVLVNAANQHAKSPPPPFEYDRGDVACFLDQKVLVVGRSIHYIYVSDKWVVSYTIKDRNGSISSYDDYELKPCKDNPE